ncbi:sugar-binding transcriptional regulator [Falsirhodobacter sp. alg1]|uniref:sugar-binding transcriptional regulator n=1 Tax=Falsirhodobacter sp. alg1 TaxID=1472418 RepID=UPI0007873C71|nr:sugar-binding domain-containing protein [Falsirhodobacter sp. alg1]
MTPADPRDAAARAGWLYYAGGRTQDQIATEMGISRQRAQRLVSRAMSEGLIRVRLEHPIAACMSLESALRDRFGLKEVRVAPSLGADDPRAIAGAAADLFETVLMRPEAQVIGLGTGRALSAMAAEIPRTEYARHTLVSLIGNIANDGLASYFEVIMRIATRINAPHYLMSAPVLTETVAECETFLGLRALRGVRDMGCSADIAFVGVGQMGPDAPLRQEGFLTESELLALQKTGAVGELLGHVYDENGNYIKNSLTERMTAVRLERDMTRLTIGVASGMKKIPALRGALAGELLSGLVTDEATATALLG